MTTYTITQTQLDLLLGVLDRAGTTDDGEYKWDTHSKATKLLQSIAPNGGDAEAAPSTIGFNGLTEAETDESMSVRGLSQKAAPSTGAEAIYQYQLANGNWIDQTKEMYDHLIKRGGSTVRAVYLAAPSTSLDTLTAENEKLRAALAEYARAGVGNSTDWHIQLSALRMATAIKGGA